MENNNLTEKYHYNGEGEHISDVSNNPLEQIYNCPKCGKEYKSEKFYLKHVEKCDVIVEEKVNENIQPVEIVEEVIVKKEVKEEKNTFFMDFYNNFVQSNNHFKIFVNDKLVFDTRKNNKQILTFNINDFRIGHNTYPYKNVKIV